MLYLSIIRILPIWNTQILSKVSSRDASNKESCKNCIPKRLPKRNFWISHITLLTNFHFLDSSRDRNFLSYCRTISRSIVTSKKLMKWSKTKQTIHKLDFPFQILSIISYLSLAIFFIRESNIPLKPTFISRTLEVVKA